MKCIIILSEKSSGSSVFHRILADTPGVNTARWTRHQEMETLYWTKAASVLDRPQVKMHQSEVPIERNRARRELIEFLHRNLDHYAPPDDDQDLILDGWRDLCRQRGPIYCEKSPHHLVQWSNLELILEC